MSGDRWKFEVDEEVVAGVVSHIRCCAVRPECKTVLYGEELGPIGCRCCGAPMPGDYFGASVIFRLVNEGRRKHGID